MYGALLMAAVANSGVAPAQAPVAPGAPPPRPDVILRWNETVLQAIKADRTPPPLAVRNLAMVHAAMYDAVNAIDRSGRPYLTDASPPAGASAETAAAVAGHRLLTALYPKQTRRFDAALDDTLADVAPAPGRTDGMVLGKFVAEEMLEWRRKDGTERQVSYAPAPGPGVWQPTPPEFRPALLPQWPRVTCFAMRSGDQFRPRPAPVLDSALYAASFHEVRALGAVNSATRTADQTEVAHFWADGDGTVTPPGHWNRIAQSVAAARGNTPAQNARLFALLNLALADAGIVAWDCKYHYQVWRPIQAIRVSDPGWTPLLPTPPFPSFTSGHSTFSGAAAAALEAFFGTDEVPFASASEGLPGVTRTFTSFSSAAAEAGRSRIYGGIHWEFDNAEGLASGRALAKYVSRNYLVPRGLPAVAEARSPAPPREK